MSGRITGVLAVCGLAVLVQTSLSPGNGALAGGEDAIMASPQTVVLGKVDSLTVHTNMPGLASPRDVTLDGVTATETWLDNRGHLAARFSIDELGLAPGQAVLTLEVVDQGDLIFSAGDTVRVR
jgi:hypothetical protein